MAATTDTLHDELIATDDLYRELAATQLLAAEAGARQAPERPSPSSLH